MSDPPISDNDFKNKMTLVWTALKNSENMPRQLTSISSVGSSVRVSVRFDT